MFKAIEFVIKSAFKLLFWLLVNLGLFIPAIFSAVYVLVCLFSNIPLTGGALTLFFLGLGLTAMAGIAFAVFRLGRKINAPSKRRPARADYQPKQSQKAFRGGLVQELDDVKNDNAEFEENLAANKRGYAQTAVSSAAVRPTSPVMERDSIGNESAFPPANLYAADLYAADLQQRAHDSYRPSQPMQQQNPYEKDQTAEPTDMRTKPRTYERAQSDARPNGSFPACDNRHEKYGADESDSQSLGAERLWERLDGLALSTDEKPMCFRLRGAKDIYVREYSDRLQYWRRQGQKMTLLKTVFKPAVGNKRRKEC